MAQAHATAPNKNVQTDVLTVYSVRQLAKQPSNLKEVKVIEYDYDASYDSYEFARRDVSDENCGWVRKDEDTIKIDPTAVLGPRVVVAGKNVSIGAEAKLLGEGDIIVEDDVVIKDYDLKSAPKGYMLVLKKSGTFAIQADNAELLR